MKRLRLPAAAFLSAAAFAPMSLAQVECHAGDTVEIRTDRRSRQTSDGSSGTSNDRDTVVERVVGVRDAGVELGYDLPESVKAAARAGSWQFPARVLKTPDGRLELLNGPAMDARVDAWLTSAKLTRAACGHWIFTWNAFRIECDPQSVLPSIEALQFPSGLTDGAPYRDPAASEVAILKRTDAGPGKATFVARMAVDADAVRRSRAESDVAAAEIGGEKLSADEARRRRSADVVSGTVTVTFETDRAGQVRRRTRLSDVTVKGQDGRSETQTVSETVERAPAGGR